MKNNVVTLTGTVSNEPVHAKAIAVAKDVAGVDQVVDKLKVGPKVGK